MQMFNFFKKKEKEERRVKADIVTPKEVIKFYHWERTDFGDEEKLERLYKEVDVLARYAKEKGLVVKLQFTIDRPPDEVVKKLTEIGDMHDVLVAVVWNDRMLMVA